MKPALKVRLDKTKRVLGAIDLFDRRDVLVGVPAPKSTRKAEAGDPIGNAALAYIHENGSAKRNIPARPFLRPGIVKAKRPITAVLRKGALAALERGGRGEIDKALERAGLVAVSSARGVIVAQEGFAPLSDRTLKARERAGFRGTKALIRTGQLVGSITYVVREARR